MPELCEACGKESNIVFVKRIKEAKSDSAVYQCSECRAFTARGSINEKNMRLLTIPEGLLWHLDEERGQFICEYNNLHLVFPADKPWSCDKCERGCVHRPHLGKATLTFRRRRTQDRPPALRAGNEV
ncbi:MAG: hypothetical protein HY558_06120 [Euryarchaeota archaeon]|nr:hypothetical protein [Euryarchaeota archaeon]